MYISDHEILIPLAGPSSQKSKSMPTFFAPLMIMFGLMAMGILITYQITMVYHFYKDKSFLWFLLFITWISSVILTWFLFRVALKQRTLWRRQQQLALHPLLRISHEGIEHSNLTAIQWSEIKDIFPHTLTIQGETRTVLRIVLRDYRTFLMRLSREKSPDIFLGFLTGIGVYLGIVIGTLITWISRSPRHDSSFDIMQNQLPIPVEGLMTEISSHFATELQEHGIALKRE